MTGSEALSTHVKTGETTLCRCWAIARQDGVTFGFTDHDLPIEFEGIAFKADSGLSAARLQQSTGLSIDNTEALGALTDAGLTETDIVAGRYDGADVRAWLVNWSDVTQRRLQFRGTIGELTRSGGAFQAELRGLTDVLNAPMGRIYQKPCTAVLGDRACGFDLTDPGYAVEMPIERIEARGSYAWPTLDGFAEGWFTHGRLRVFSGAADGLWGSIKTDRIEDGLRRVTLWTPLRADLSVGDRVRLEAGCDKRAESCRLKFNNFMNFQGFPDIPGEDWMLAYPRSGQPNTGGSRR